MENKKEREAVKKPYAKPCLRCVELLSDEVLAKGCKLESGGFNINVAPCTAAACSQADS